MDVKLFCENNIVNTKPNYVTEFESGADVVANIENDIELNGFSRVLISTGVFPEIPKGYEIQVRPKSGLAYKFGVTVLNTPGTIDASYRGEICIILMNTTPNKFVVKKGMKIAQLVLSKVEQANYILVNSRDELTSTERGVKGFGEMTKTKEKQKQSYSTAITEREHKDFGEISKEKQKQSYDFDLLLNKNIIFVEKYLMYFNFKYRIVSEDSKNYTITDDFDDTRLNLFFENDLLVKYYLG